MTAPITPMEYKLTIEPDLDRFTFAGRMILSANADEPTDTLILDCAELAIWQCRIEPSPGKRRGWLAKRFNRMDR